MQTVTCTLSLPVEIYKILAGMVETLQCYQTLALLCHNSSTGCKLYREDIEKKHSNINVQITYNFGGHNSNNYWHYLHQPFKIPYDEFVNSAKRKQVRCTKNSNETCEYSRYYMSRSDDITWYDQQEWDICKEPNIWC